MTASQQGNRTKNPGGFDLNPGAGFETQGLGSRNPHLGSSNPSVLGSSNPSVLAFENQKWNQQHDPALQPLAGTSTGPSPPANFTWFPFFLSHFPEN
ncbi:hypothetical protein SLEP1_g37037 [Rubroshorea leprosula]|uniref:Uncharacterized protein n=1 Tax=Rubroshorea leprosula TaxID=152421 RepID=A0AAV5KTF5_9ROSI|nr:hypothetical protein SLEP1_g37037 [Rubroshorea leprosula]